MAGRCNCGIAGKCDLRAYNSYAQRVYFDCKSGSVIKDTHKAYVHVVGFTCNMVRAAALARLVLTGMNGQTG